MSFYTLLTATGQAKITAAIASGIPVVLTQMAVGDGGGAAVTPVENRAALVNEVNRGPLNNLTVDAVNPNWFTAERVIAPDVGGWTIREVGLFDAAGTLIAYGNFPESYKPMLAEGSGKELVIRVQCEVSETSAITILVDPSVVLATQIWTLAQLKTATRIGRPGLYFISQS